MTAAEIDRKNGIAMWRQIADAIRAAISSGDFAVERPLPAEMTLADRFGVNRHTVRSAIASLVQEGILRAERGRGTFVERRPQFEFAISKRTRFSEGLSARAQRGEGRMIASGRMLADAEIAAALGISEGTETIFVEMLYVVEEVPISIATNYFEAERFDAIAGHVSRTGSITTALAACGVEDYTRRRTAITARHADSRDTAHLALSPGAIVLFVTSVNVDGSGEPIQFARTRFAADRATLSVEEPDTH